MCGARFSSVCSTLPLLIKPRTIPPSAASLTLQEKEGYDYLSVVNLYAARSTNPKGLASFNDPIGPDNDNTIRTEVRQANLVIAAWGVLPTIPGLETRAKQVLALLTVGHDVFRLGEATKDGYPPHPLYLPKDPPLRLHAPQSTVETPL